MTPVTPAAAAAAVNQAAAAAAAAASVAQLNSALGDTAEQELHGAAVAAVAASAPHRSVASSNVFWHFSATAILQ